MSGAELAGRLTERVTVSRETGARDALGAGAEWGLVGRVWAEVRPEQRGAAFVGEARSGLPVWRVTMRRTAVTVGDRLGWGVRTMVVRTVTEDPAEPDRLVAIAEEER